jgi:FKBP-type peptidyl-prolyl cis-trans isomerase
MNVLQKLVLAAGLFCSFSLAAQNTQKSASSNTKKLLNKEDSLQYAMGVWVGQWILENGFTSFDPVHFMDGLGDILKKQPRRINDSLIIPLLADHKKDIQKALTRELETRLFKSIADTPGVQSLQGGIKYLVRKQGTGLKPAEKDSVLISFKGVFSDGTVFEDTYAKKVAVHTTPGTLFPGMRLALMAMPAGSVWQLYIPSAMAYGDTGNGTTVPPGQALIILLNLIDVKKHP